MSNPAPPESVAIAIPCPRPKCRAGIGEPCINPRTLARAATTRPHIERYEEWRKHPAAAVLVEVATTRMQFRTPPVADALSAMTRADLISTAATCVALAEGWTS